MIQNSAVATATMDASEATEQAERQSPQAVQVQARDINRRHRWPLSAARGHPSLGVSGIFGDADDVRAHGQDERIRIDHFYEGQEFLYRLVKALADGS